MPDVSVPVALLVYALAVTRLTGLVVSDSITEPARERVLVELDRRNAGRQRSGWSLLAELIGCPWCAGMWISIFAAPLVWLWGMSPVMLVPALALAFSQAAGMTHGIGRYTS